VSCLDGSDDLLILEMELVADSAEFALSQGDVDILGDELHRLGHQVFEVVKTMEGDSHNAWPVKTMDNALFCFCRCHCDRQTNFHGHQSGLQEQAMLVGK